MGRIRRYVTLLAATAVALSVVATPVSAAPGESSFVAKINAEREARGLGPVESYWDLVDDARSHSAKMMDEDRLHHNANLGSVTSGWNALGENVGVGPSVSSLHDAFMASSGHRANILGDFNYVGVGVVHESDTKLWVTVVFMKGPEGLVSPPAEESPSEAAEEESEAAPEPAPEPAPAPAAEEAPQPAPEPVAEPEPQAVPAAAARPAKAAAPQPAPVPPEAPVHVPRFGHGGHRPYIV